MYYSLNAYIRMPPSPASTHPIPVPTSLCFQVPCFSVSFQTKSRPPRIATDHGIPGCHKSRNNPCIKAGGCYPAGGKVSEEPAKESETS